MERMMGKLSFLVVVKWAAAIGLSAAIASSLTGCAVFTVADAAVSVAATAVKVTAKTVGVAADIVLPSSDKKAEKDKDGSKR
jgi:hypothetical protein